MKQLDYTKKKSENMNVQDKPNNASHSNVNDYEMRLNIPKMEFEDKMKIENKKYQEEIDELNIKLNYYKEINNCLEKRYGNRNRKFIEKPEYTKIQLEALANTKPYRIAYFMRRFSLEFLKGDKNNKKDFLKWSYCKILKKESGLENKYNYLLELTKRI